MPYFFYYGFDWTYLFLVLPCLLISLWASSNVNSTFKKYANQLSHRNLTGAQAAQRVLSANGVTNVRFERVSGNLTDHYDPRTNVIRLSDSVYDSTSTAAIGVACHEAGHAVQYANGYAPIKLRAAIIPITNIGSTISIPLVLIGFFMGMQPLVNFGILLFATVAVFQLVTLPVEFNASRRAVDALEMGGTMADDEMKAVKKVLSAAAMTYVAALAVSVANLLRLILRFGGRNRD